MNHTNYRLFHTLRSHLRLWRGFVGVLLLSIFSQGIYAAQNHEIPHQHRELPLSQLWHHVLQHHDADHGHHHAQADVTHDTMSTTDLLAELNDVAHTHAAHTLTTLALSCEIYQPAIHASPRVYSPPAAIIRIPLGSSAPLLRPPATT